VIRRLFYIAFGATIGVLVVRRVNAFVASWTPQGLATRVGGVGGSIAAWWAIVQDSAAEREAELRATLGLDAIESGDSRRRDGERTRGEVA
jgi:hypothetical protein